MQCQIMYNQAKLMVYLGHPEPGLFERGVGISPAAGSSKIKLFFASLPAWQGFMALFSVVHIDFCLQELLSVGFLDEKSRKNQGLILSAEKAPIIKPLLGADSVCIYKGVGC
jgi:hypothetical protein